MTGHLLSTREEGPKLLTDGLADLRRSLSGLDRHIADLDLLGYTVIENALAPETVQSLRDGLLAVAAEEDGARPDTVTGLSHANRTQEVVLLLTRGGRAYEELLLTPTPLALITYLLGRNRC